MVAGPTASGKSAFALGLAREFGGVVINADSMQVYRDLPILTAQPDAADRQLAAHRMYGFLGSDERLSAAGWADLARQEITEAIEAAKVPIVVGGTGLYLRALVQGLSPVPAIPRPIHEQARALLTAIGASALHAKLAEVDPEIAGRLHRNDAQRITRAWEVHAATGVPLSRWQGMPAPGEPGRRYLGLVGVPPRVELNQRIDQRVLGMVAAGVLPEVSGVLASMAEDRWSQGAGRILGFREFAEHLRHGTRLEDAVAAVQKRTRQYAKRQMTWMRHQLPFGNLITLDGLFEKLSAQKLADFRHKIRSFLLTE